MNNKINNTLPISRSMAFLRRDYTLNEERIFLNMCILAKCQLDADGKYSGEFGEIITVKNTKGQPILYEVNFYISKILNAKNKDGKAYKNYDIIRSAFKSFNTKHIFALAPNGIDWIDLPPFAMSLSNIREGVVKTTITPQIWNMFTNTSQTYNKLDMIIAYKLSALYSLRLYEMFGGLDKPLEININTFKEYYKLENAYKNNNDFLKRVVFKAIQDLANEEIYIPVQINRNGSGKTSEIKSVTVYPEIHKKNLLKGVKQYGINRFLNEDECSAAQNIFTEQEIINNIETFLYVKWQTKSNLSKKITELSQKSKDKENPKGWIISTLKSIPKISIKSLID